MPMMSRAALVHALLVMVCAGVACRQAPAAQPVAAAQPANAAADEIAALKADV